MFERYIFLKSDNKIIDTLGHDIKASMMVERAFVLSEAGQFHRYLDEDGKPKVEPMTQYWLMSNEKSGIRAYV